MEGSKKYLAAVVILAVVLCGWYLIFGRAKPVVDDRIKMVCVETGELFRLSRAELGNAFPVVNPETKRATLLPYVEKDGQKMLPARRRQALLDLGDLNKYVDTETLIVREPD